MSAARSRIRPGARRWDVLAGLVVVLILFGGLLAVIVFLPPRVVEHPRDLSTADWLKAVQDLRTTILQGLGGLALLGTLYFSARTLELNRRGQVTEPPGVAEVRPLWARTLQV
jgi:hypothetical protein